MAWFPCGAKPFLFFGSPAGLLQVLFCKWEWRWHLVCGLVSCSQIRRLPGREGCHAEGLWPWNGADFPFGPQTLWALAAVLATA